MHRRCLSRGSHKGVAAAPALETSAGSAQQADGGGRGDATSSQMFIQAATRLCCSHEGNSLYSTSGFSELACLKPSSVEILNNGLAEIRKGIEDYKSVGSKPLRPWWAGGRSCTCGLL